MHQKYRSQRAAPYIASPSRAVAKVEQVDFWRPTYLQLELRLSKQEYHWRGLGLLWGSSRANDRDSLYKRYPLGWRTMAKSQSLKELALALKPEACYRNLLGKLPAVAFTTELTESYLIRFQFTVAVDWEENYSGTAWSNPWYRSLGLCQVMVFKSV